MISKGVVCGQALFDFPQLRRGASKLQSARKRGWARVRLPLRAEERYMMKAGHRQICQRSAVLVALPLAPFWLLFAAINYPFIVPADHSSGLVSAFHGAAMAGFALVALSVVSMLWAAGVIGQAAANRGFALLLLGGIAVASVWLYPADSGLGLGMLRLPAQAAGAAVVFLGMAGQRYESDTIRQHE